MTWIDKHWLGVLITILLAGFIVTSCMGCAQITAAQTAPDGTKVEISYTRWANQEIGGFTLTSPSGWVIGFDGQKSEFETAFNLGAASVKIGGGGQ